MRNHTSRTRDAALYQLSRINRWTIAGSVVLTGVLAEVAAHAFPGKPARAGTAIKDGARSTTSREASAAGEQPLAAPSQAPEAQAQESAPSAEAEAEAEAGESAPPEAEAGEAAPQQEAPAEEAVPQESAPQEAPVEEAPEPYGPVISGGS
jgi:hypothetical protein